MHLIRTRNAAGKESGQILPLFAIMLPLLFLFVGLGIDFGFAYLTKAELAKASDAASLAAMRNLGRGQAEATAIGQSVFALNYSATVPSVSITYSKDSYGDPAVNVSATATIHTHFIGFAGFKTLTVGAVSQATRPPIILSIVLDKSGSMNLNGGATALPPSVQDFLGYFMEGTDQVGEVSFSSIATSDVPITRSFQTPISTFLKNMKFGGATYAQGGLLDGQAQVQGVSSAPPNAVQVVVFFTDGWANTNQDTLTCSRNPVNYGGCSPVEQSVGWCSGVSFLSPSNGSSVSCNATTFPAHDPGLSHVINPADISTEAMYRAVQLANVMRNQGTTIYAIGLGDKINETYLQELANDPASPEYDPHQPAGLAEFAPTASDLDNAFQTIASRILLRLTQ